MGIHSNQWRRLTPRSLRVCNSSSEEKQLQNNELIYILITIRVLKITKVTSQALYKKNIEIKEKKKKINESSDDF